MPDLSSLGARSRGVWTRADALALLTRGQIRGRLLDGDWQIVLPGIYADGGIELDHEQRAFAAVMASGGSAGQPERREDRASWKAIAMGRTAARAWGFPLIDDDDPSVKAFEAGIDEVGVRTGRRTLVVPTDDDAPAREVRRHRVTLDPLDVARLPSGLILTAPLRTLFDCATLLTHEALVCAMDDALHRKKVSAEALEAYELAHRWWTGGPAFRAARALADGRSESPHETLVRLLLLPHLPTLRPQVELRERRRLVARFDLGDEEASFAVEADGKAGHAGAMVAKDQQRDHRTSAFGWRTERVTWFNARRQQDATVTRVVQAYVEHRESAARRAA
jgi:hypothetical protein